MFPGIYLYSFIKIESVTAEIFLGGWGVQSHFQVKPNLVLGWGFDKNKVKLLILGYT